MKKILLVLALPILAFSLLTAQNDKPKKGNKYPTFIKLPKNTKAEKGKKIFEEVFEMTPSDELRSKEKKTDELGFTHEKYQQYYQNIEVDGATFTQHIKDGNIELLTGNFRSISDLNANPSKSAAQALSLAIAKVGARSYIWDGPGGQKPEGQLVVVADPEGEKSARLAYKFDIYATDPVSRAYVYIDAHSGEYIQSFERIHTQDVPATGNSLYNGNVGFTADFTGSAYRLRQTADGNGIQTFSLNNGTNYNAATDITSGTTNFTSDNTAVQAHWGAEKTHQYYLSTHNRNSFDGAGGIIKSYVHYSNNYVNAFWDGSRMTYGDGDGVSYGPLVSLDIVGHEITHGVTEYSANLVYSYESGALNESFSDIFGEAIEHFATGSNDWQMGTDIGIGGSGAIRSMNNPNAFNDPDTYQGTYWYTGTGDNGGVHINSGVQNKWFYILSVGEGGTNDLGNAYSVTGIGIAKAAAIAYRNLSTYLSSSSNYADARAGAIQSAIDLYGAGSPEEIATTNAWYAVGVGGEYGTISYCSSKGNNANYEWIAGVTIGAFTNTSGKAGYSNFTSQTVNLNAGQTYSISLTPGFASTVYNEYWKIWIDYNADGDFSDAGELAFDAGALRNSTVNGTISVPANASGQTRLRVSMKYNGAQTACETFAYGEVEDYTVAFATGGADTQPPSAPGNLTASNTTQTSTDLSWTASTDNVGVTGYNVYVDGVLKGTTTATSYAVSGLTAATTYAMEVTAEDAAGNESAPATANVTTAGGGGGGTTTILAHYFESGWDGWADGGSDCARYSGGFSWEGNWSIQLRDNSGTASAMTSSSYNVSGFSQLEIEFYFYPNSMENGEDFFVRYYNGSVWQTVAAYAAGSSFNNGSFYVATVRLSSADYNFPTNAQFRFQCDASANSDQIYIDAVTVRGTAAAALVADKGSSQSLRVLGAPGRQVASAQDGANRRVVEQDEALIYPNPAGSYLKIEVAPTESIRAVTVRAANGAVVRRISAFDSGDVLDLNGLEGGVYFLSIETEQEVINKRFVKQ